MTPGGLGPTIIGVVIVESLIGLIFVSLRIWARLRLLSGMRLDDYMLFISQVRFEGLGQHSWELAHEHTVQANKLITIAISFIALALATSKASVAFFLLLIVIEKWHKITLWIATIALSVECIFNFIAFYVQCTPVEAIWNTSLPHVCHINITVAGIVLASCGTFLDFFFAALPWYFLRNLHMKRKEKLTINLSLSAGVFAGICGAIRVTKATALSAKSDFQYKVVPLLLWSTTELTVTIVCVCLPTMLPLWRRYVKGLSKSGSEAAIYHGQNGYPLNGRSNAGNNTFTVTAGGGIKHSKRPDNQSAENILGEEFRADAIKETRSVVIEYDDQITDRSEHGVYVGNAV
ncbi:hypothetical protein K432DRAFT_439566 [Lepidopterella palustris CBS 459.81]|uniref:Rhodopsin domain-containing protein n=1 Tax=Lepidopterella palustris CBS 459.81 TaxID=1314670 RepID=A0A8E2JJI9_9PEZI|nr:hypothetical protein K432DRAFT_439566 [Lepidopterella palustris CBS 459.81]